MSGQEKPLIERIEEYLRNRLDTGYKCTDKNSILELRKQCHDALKMKKGSFYHTKTVLNKLLKEKKIILPHQPISEGSIKIDFDTTGNDETVITDRSPIQSQEVILDTSSESPTQKTLPLEKIALSPQVEKTNQDAFRGTFKMVGQIYSALGLIEGKGDSIKYQPMTEQKFLQESEEFANTLGTFCYNHGIALPMIIEAISLIGTAFVIFGLPIVNLVLFKNTTHKEDESLKDVKTESVVQ